MNENKKLKNCIEIKTLASGVLTKDTQKLQRLSDEEKLLILEHIISCTSCNDSDMDQLLYALMRYENNEYFYTPPLAGNDRKVVIEKIVGEFMEEFKSHQCKNKQDSKSYKTGFAERQWRVSQRKFNAGRVAVVALAVSVMVILFVILVSAGKKRNDTHAILETIYCHSSGDNFLTNKEFNCTRNTVKAGSKINTQKEFVTLAEKGQRSYLLFADRNSVISIGSIHNKRRFIRLERGNIVIKVPAGEKKISVEIEAGNCIIRDIGTIFKVEFTPSSNLLSISAVEGSISVENKIIGLSNKEDKSEIILHSGKKFLFYNTTIPVDVKQFQLDETEKTEIIDAVRVMDRWRTFLKDNAVSVNGNEFHNRAEEILKKGEYVKKANESTTAGEKADLKTQEAIRKSNGKTEKFPDASSRISSKTPDELLNLAKQYRIDKNWKEALRTYNRLIELYPDSRQSEIALIHAGEIKLEKQQDYKSALNYFNRYREKHSKGALLEEAWYGIIRCYYKTGNSKKEMEEINGFLNKFPVSPYSNSLRLRLHKLSNDFGGNKKVKNF